MRPSLPPHTSSAQHAWNSGREPVHRTRRHSIAGACARSVPIVRYSSAWSHRSNSRGQPSRPVSTDCSAAQSRGTSFRCGNRPYVAAAASPYARRPGNPPCCPTTEVIRNRPKLSSLSPPPGSPSTIERRRLHCTNASPRRTAPIVFRRANQTLIHFRMASRSLGVLYSAKVVMTTGIELASRFRRADGRPFGT